MQTPFSGTIDCLFSGKSTGIFSGAKNLSYFCPISWIMFLTLLSLSVIIVSLSLMGLGIRMLIIRGGRFPVTSVGGNIHLKKKGITCPKHDELRGHRKRRQDGLCTDCGYQV